MVFFPIKMSKCSHGHVLWIKKNVDICKFASKTIKMKNISQYTIVILVVKLPNYQKTIFSDKKSVKITLLAWLYSVKNQSNE